MKVTLRGVVIEIVPVEENERVVEAFNEALLDDDKVDEADVEWVKLNVGLELDSSTEDEMLSERLRRTLLLLEGLTVSLALKSRDELRVGVDVGDALFDDV